MFGEQYFVFLPVETKSRKNKIKSKKEIVIAPPFPSMLIDNSVVLMPSDNFFCSIERSRICRVRGHIVKKIMRLHLPEMLSLLKYPEVFQ